MQDLSGILPWLLGPDTAHLDVLVVWRLDRLGRSLRYLIETIALLQHRSIGLKSLTENTDTTTPGGKLIFHVFGALREFERDLIRERTQAGLATARDRGRRARRQMRPAIVAAGDEAGLNCRWQGRTDSGSDRFVGTEVSTRVGSRPAFALRHSTMEGWLPSHSLRASVSTRASSPGDRGRAGELSCIRFAPKFHMCQGTPPRMKKGILPARRGQRPKIGSSPLVRVSPA